MTDTSTQASTPHLSPLAGVTIVEIGQNVAAPAAAQILADLGARVIKVEKPKGDDARHWGPPYWEGAASMFQSMNRNKLSVVVNFRDRDDVEALSRLIQEEADVVLQSMRPGLLQEHGLDSERLRQSCPRLIWCDLGAFGAGGPLGQQPGYDPLMQAFAGLMSVTGVTGGEPVRTGYSVVDVGTGMWAAMAILAALYRRKDTGVGGQLDVSLFETAMSWMSAAAAHYQSSGEIPEKHGSGAPAIVPYRAYQAKDGHIVVAAGNDTLFRRFALALGRPEWPEDPKFNGNPQRVAHRDELDQHIEQLMSEQSVAYWIECLNRADVPCAPVQNVSQALAHPQTAALGVVQPVPDSTMSLVGLPIRFDSHRPAIRSAPPALNADAELLDRYRVAASEA